MNTTNPTCITKDDVSIWYGIKPSGLRKRLAKKPNPLRILNRALTMSDVRNIIEKAGEPPFLPPAMRCLIYTKDT